MEQRTNSPYPAPRSAHARHRRRAAGCWRGAVHRNDREHEWRFYQYDFKRLVAEKLGADKARTVPTGLQQIWIPSLGRADRCVTCHQAVSWKGFETAEEPYRTHPAEPLKNHPSRSSAARHATAGRDGPSMRCRRMARWSTGRSRCSDRNSATAYSLVDNKSALMQMNCNTCHRYDRQTPGADMINLAKQVVNDKGCRACHVINSRGGTIGPDLTDVGDKAPEQYEYGRLSGQKTAFAWHVAHLKDPRALVADTVMPNFHLTSRKRRHWPS